MAKPKWPFPWENMVSDFGDKKDRAAPHTGVDFGRVGNGAPIRAGGPGIVHFAGPHNASAGNVVSIRYDGIAGTAMYCHVQARYPMAKGTRVKAGDIIAYVGSSGSATGPHLHLGFFMDKGTKLTDPKEVFAGFLTDEVKYSREHITKVQLLLIKLGYDLGRWGADGILGTMTNIAVRSFQASEGLVVDGLPGPRTLAALEVAVAGITEPPTEPVEPEPEPVEPPAPVEPGPPIEEPTEPEVPEPEVPVEPDPPVEEPIEPEPKRGWTTAHTIVTAVVAIATAILTLIGVRW